MEKLTVIIINYNTAETTEKAIKAFRSAEPSLDARFILIDNGSTPAMQWSDEDNRLMLIRNNENKGFAAAANQGLKLAETEYSLLLNSDVFIKPGSISALLRYLKANPAVGIIGPQLLFPNGDFQPSCGRFPNLIREFFRFSLLGKIFPFDTVIYKTIFNRSFFKKAQNIDWISGACLMLKSEVLKKIGYLDEGFFFGVEDFDFCRRAKSAGFKIVYFPEAIALHHHGLSSGGHRSVKSLLFERQGMLYLLKKHWPQKKALRAFVAFMYVIKISLRRLLGL